MDNRAGLALGHCVVGQIQPDAAYYANIQIVLLTAIYCSVSSLLLLLRRSNSN